MYVYTAHGVSPESILILNKYVSRERSYSKQQ